MLIDFEIKFAEYLDEYVQAKHLDDDMIEEMTPDLYLEWLEQPKPWLDGRSPNAYFSEMNPVTLIKTLGQIYAFRDKAARAAFKPYRRYSRRHVSTFDFSVEKLRW